MALKAVLDSLDGVPEGLREFYTEQDGRYYLSAEGVDDLPAVRGLKTAFSKTKEQLQELKSRYDGIDPEEARAAAEKARAAEEEALRKSGDVEKVRKTMSDAFEKERGEFKGEIAKRDDFIHRLLVRNALGEAMAKVGVADEYREAVRALLMEQKPQVVQEGDDYRAVFRTDTGDVSLGEHVEKWAKTDAALAFLKANGTTGSGARGGGGGGGGEPNPWAAETFNVTRQSEIFSTDPKRAERLKAAAGVR